MDKSALVLAVGGMRRKVLLNFDLRRFIIRKRRMVAFGSPEPKKTSRLSQSLYRSRWYVHLRDRLRK
jgi:hypothetical protein